jgi:hypothetical protein
MTKTDEAILDQAHHMKVSPAAIPYLRRFAVYPKHVKATGPRKHLTKGDVLEYVKKMNLHPVVLKRPASDYIDMNEFKVQQKEV